MSWVKSEAISYNKVDLKDSFETKHASLSQIIREIEKLQLINLIGQLWPNEVSWVKYQAILYNKVDL